MTSPARFLSELATTAELEREFKRSRFQQRRYAERGSSNQATVPAIKMLLAIGTSIEITARD
jgi:hypothetical protein